MVLKPALRLLAARARSVGELRERLLKKGLEAKDVSHCINWLSERRLLDDEAFARSLILDRIRFSPRSPFLLKRELTEKGVGSSLAERTLDSLLDEEGLSAKDLSREAGREWVRKQGSKVRSDLLGPRFQKQPEKARRRLYGFLARRGFVGDAARAGLEAGIERARELESAEGPDP